jgi:hypothetical protein
VAEARRDAPDALVAVAWRDLATGRALDVRGDSVFHAASTMKLPVMIELMRQVDRGTLALDRGVPLVNRFASIVDGSPYSLSPADDSDSALYALVGQSVPVRELMTRMIVRSSNLATNALIALAAPLSRVELEESLGDQIVRENVIEWSAIDAAVVTVRRERLGAIVLCESPLRDADPMAVADTLLHGLSTDRGIALRWSDDAARLRARLAFLHRHLTGWPDVGEEALRATARAPASACLRPSAATASRSAAHATSLHPYRSHPSSTRGHRPSSRAPAGPSAARASDRSRDRIPPSSPGSGRWRARNRGSGTTSRDRP